MKLELNRVYKDREGNQWKTVLYKEGYARPFTAVNKAQDCDACYKENGSWEVHESERDLIELVGDDFKKEPRKIEFEAYLGHYDTEAFRGNHSLDINLNSYCSEFRKNKLVFETNSEIKSISKWEVTMKEIIE